MLFGYPRTKIFKLVLVVTDHYTSTSGSFLAYSEEQLFIKIKLILAWQRNNFNK